MLGGIGITRFPGRSLSLAMICFILLTLSPAYSAEIDHIRAALKATDAQWVAEENPISILPPEVRAKRLGSLGPRREISKTGLQSFEPPVEASLPSSFDWRNYNGGNFVTPVRNQGHCGSCWAFATTAALESKALITFNWPGNKLNLSEQILLSCSGAGDCQVGGYIDDASDFLRDTGINLETCYGYKATDGNCGSACATWQSRPYRINGWSWVAYGSAPTQTALKNAIYTNGPVVVSLNVYTDFYFYHSGVYHCSWGAYEGGHAVLVVGWDDSTGAFIVKNSWAPRWGESGYFRIGYGELTSAYTQFANWAISFGDVDIVSVTLRQPDGGESAHSGSTYSIQWEAPPDSEEFSLFYSLNNGSTWKPIASGVSGTSYPWEVPIAASNQTKCRVKVQDFVGGKKISEDKSFSNFTIEVVKLTSPDGGESLTCGDPFPITWETNGTQTTVAAVKLFYSINAGHTWIQIPAVITGNPGGYSWTVPDLKDTQSQCRVKVLLTDAKGKSIGSDLSDGDLTIHP